MADTQPEAFEVLIELPRRMTPGEKLTALFDVSAMLMRLAEENVRKLYPEASEREVFLCTAARRLDRDTMIRVYGWDPDRAETE